MRQHNTEAKVDRVHIAKYLCEVILVEKSVEKHQTQKGPMELRHQTFRAHPHRTSALILTDISTVLDGTCHNNTVC